MDMLFRDLLWSLRCGPRSPRPLACAPSLIQPGIRDIPYGKPHSEMLCSSRSSCFSHSLFELGKLFHSVSPFPSWLPSQCWLLTGSFGPTPCGLLHRLLECCHNILQKKTNCLKPHTLYNILLTTQGQGVITYRMDT